MTNASSLLTTKKRSHLEALLHWNVDIFAWSHSDMLRIDVFVVAHKLNILPNMRSERQKVWSFHPNCQKVIQMVIDKLLLASFIQEVAYLDCLTNIVVVPKKRGTWRVCVDYTNLNDACPNDSFLLPRIDQIVDSTSGNGMLSFLNVVSDYHQIPMFHLDQEKTTFITLHGLYYYNIMPLG